VAVICREIGGSFFEKNPRVKIEAKRGATFATFATYYISMNYIVNILFTFSYVLLPKMSFAYFLGVLLPIGILVAILTFSYVIDF